MPAAFWRERSASAARSARRFMRSIAHFGAAQSKVTAFGGALLLAVAVVAIAAPAVVAYPLAVLGAWVGASLRRPFDQAALRAERQRPMNKSARKRYRAASRVPAASVTSGPCWGMEGGTVKMVSWNLLYRSGATLTNKKSSA